MAIQSVNTLISQAQAMRSAPVDSSSTSFTALLGKALEPVRATAAEAQVQSVGLLTGQTDQIHSVVLAAEKADLALRLTLQIRNKVLDAYQEIMRMQV